MKSSEQILDWINYAVKLNEQTIGTYSLLTDITQEASRIEILKQLKQFIESDE